MIVSLWGAIGKFVFASQFALTKHRQTWLNARHGGESVDDEQHEAPRAIRSHQSNFRHTQRTAVGVRWRGDGRIQQTPHTEEPVMAAKKTKKKTAKKSTKKKAKR